MTQHDVVAACNRLVATLERALALEQRSWAALDDAIREPLIPYLLAQLRMRICPALTSGWLTLDPLHVSLFGGTNSGKSTLLNVLLGRSAAGMNVTARFSQHPEAYRSPALGDQWLDAFPSRFPGYQRYRNERPPRQPNDELVRGHYHPVIAILDSEHEPVSASTQPATPPAVFWDVPDFSTEEARVYLSAVLDVVALADVVIMAVTDESYADDRGRVFFRMVRNSGVSLHVVANKLVESSDLLADIKAKMNETWQGQAPTLPPVQFHRLHRVEGTTPEARLKNLLHTREAALLREAIAQEVKRGPALKRQTLAGAVHFLAQRLDEALRPLVTEMEVAGLWDSTVQRITRDEFLERYRSDYLYAQRYGEFNQALIQLMELLEIPGIGPFMKFLRGAVRMPVRVAKRLLSHLFFGPATSTVARLPEHEVVTKLFTQWWAALKSEAQTLANTRMHPAWGDVVRGLESRECHDHLRRAFEPAYLAYRQDIDQEIQQHSQEIYRTIAQSPTLLNTLRGANLAADAATFFLIVKTGGIDWSDAVVGPIVAGLRRVLLEAGMEAYLERQKRLLQHKQFEAMQHVVLEHLVQPVRELFVREVRTDEVEQARRDFTMIQAAALNVAHGEEV